MGCRWGFASSFCLLAAAALGQTTPGVRPAAKGWTLPRTPDGQPDLQGNWNNSTLTQLQRPARFANQQYLSEQETVTLETEIAKNSNWDRPGAPPQPGTGLGYNYLFWDAGTKLARLDGRGLTSLIIDPPDGRVPPLTAEARSGTSRRAPQAFAV